MHCSKTQACRGNTDYEREGNMHDNLLTLDGWQCQGAERQVADSCMTLHSLGNLSACAWRTLAVDLDQTPALFLRIEQLCDIEAVEVRFRTSHLPAELRDRVEAVVGPYILDKPAELRALLDRCYPEPPAGTAWMARVADLIFAMQTHENRIEIQTFVFDLKPPFVRLAGTLDSHGCILARLAGNRLFVHAQAGQRQQAVLRLTTTGHDPVVVCAAADAVCWRRWNAATLELEIRVESHKLCSMELRESALTQGGIP